MIKMLWYFLVACICCFCFTQARVALPNFEKLKEIFPGYIHHGGHHSDEVIYSLIGGRSKDLNLRETTGLRLSYTFNRIGEKHKIKNHPEELTNLTNVWSLKGDDGEYYLENALAFGPYLAEKYGEPLMVRPGLWTREKIMDDFIGKKGITRVVTYDKKHKASAYMGLWDCEKFYKSRNWNKVHHLLSVEFWEIKDDSGCNKKHHGKKKHHKKHQKNHRKKWKVTL